MAEPDHLASGFKADADKVRTDLLPPDVLMHVSEVLTFGANKYKARNWEKGMAYGRLLGATLRHVFAIMRGEDFDPETGLLHSAHAICCLMFLCGFQLRGMHEHDDRNKLADHAATEGAWQAGFGGTSMELRPAAPEPNMGGIKGAVDPNPLRWRV